MRLVFADILLSQFYLSAWRWRKTLYFLQPDEMPPARLLSFLRRNQCFLLGWPTAKEADQVHQGWEGEIRTRMPLSTHRPVGNKRELVQWPSLCEKTAPKSWDVSLVLHVLSTAQFTVSVWISVDCCHVLTGLSSLLPGRAGQGPLPIKKSAYKSLVEGGTV